MDKNTQLKAQNLLELACEAGKYLPPRFSLETPEEKLEREKNLRDEVLERWDVQGLEMKNLNSVMKPGYQLTGHLKPAIGDWFDFQLSFKTTTLQLIVYHRERLKIRWDYIEKNADKEYSRVQPTKNRYYIENFVSLKFKDLRESCDWKQISSYYKKRKMHVGTSVIKKMVEGELQQEWIEEDQRNPKPLQLKKIYQKENHQAARQAKKYLKKNKIKVAVVDSGVDYNHPQIAYKINRHRIGYDFYERDRVPYDSSDGGDRSSFHGSHVSGILAHQNPYVQILTIKKPDVYQDSARNWRKMIGAAVRSGARIINMSISHTLASVKEGHSDKICRAIALFPRTLFIVAAGNEGVDNDQHGLFPSACPQNNVLSVAWAVSPSKLSDDSNFGKKSIDLAAMGEDVLSLKAGGDSLEKLSGTSMATPLVARVASQILYWKPYWSAKRVIAHLKKTCELRPEWSEKLKYSCFLNPEKVIEGLKLSRRQRKAHSCYSACVKTDPWNVEHDLTCQSQCL